MGRVRVPQDDFQGPSTAIDALRPRESWSRPGAPPVRERGGERHAMSAARAGEGPALPGQHKQEE